MEGANGFIGGAFFLGGLGSWEMVFRWNLVLGLLVGYGWTNERI